MPELPLIFARQSVGGEQELADGSKLQNWFAVLAEEADRSQSPVLLYPTPGFHPVIRIGKGTTLGTRYGGIQGLISADSPVRGRRMVGIIGASHLFEIAEGRPLAPGEFRPIHNAAGRVFYPEADTLPAVSALSLTRIGAERAPSIEERQTPIKIVTDGQYFMFLDRQGTPRMWQTNDDPARAGFWIDIGTTTGEADKLDETDTWADVAYLAGYFIAATTRGKIVHSGLNTTEFSALDFGSASRHFDPLVALETFGGQLYAMGGKTVEIFSDVGTTPFTLRRHDYVVPIGCLTKTAVAKNEDGIYFLGNDQIVYALNFADLHRISTDSVEFDIRLSVQERSRAFLYSEEGHDFYSLSLFGRDGRWRNWTLDLRTGFWHNRADGPEAGFSVLCIADFGHYNLVGRDDSRSTETESFLHAMSRDLVTDDDRAVVRSAVSPNFFNRLNPLAFPSLSVRTEVTGEREYMPVGTPGDPAFVSAEQSRADRHVIKLRWEDRKPDKVSDFKNVPLDQSVARWRRLGQTQTGRRFLLLTQARAEVKLIAAAIDLRYRKGHGGISGPSREQNDGALRGVIVVDLTDITSITGHSGIDVSVSPQGDVVITIASPLALEYGGTGGKTAEQARANLELGSAALLAAGEQAGQLPILDQAAKVKVSHIVRPFMAVPFDAALAWDVASRPNGIVTLTADAVLSITGHEDGGTYTLAIYQDSVGGHALTFPAALQWRNSMAGEIAQAAGAKTILAVKREGANLIAAPLLRAVA